MHITTWATDTGGVGSGTPSVSANACRRARRYLRGGEADVPLRLRVVAGPGSRRLGQPFGAHEPVMTSPPSPPVVGSDTDRRGA